MPYHLATPQFYLRLVSCRMQATLAGVYLCYNLNYCKSFFYNVNFYRDFFINCVCVLVNKSSARSSFSISIKLLAEPNNSPEACLFWPFFNIRIGIGCSVIRYCYAAHLFQVGCFHNIFPGFIFLKVKHIKRIFMGIALYFFSTYLSEFALCF